MIDATLELIDPATGEVIASADAAAVMAPADKGKFSEAPSVAEVAARLISDETHFTSLAEAKISYLFRTGEWLSKGYTVLGKVFPMDERARYNTGYDLQVVINKWVWQHTDEKQHEALVAHELCHIEKSYNDSGKVSYSVAAHDLEEFRYIAKRYGAWDEGLQKFLAAFQAGEADRKQPTLFGEGDNESN